LRLQEAEQSTSQFIPDEEAQTFLNRVATARLYILFHQGDLATSVALAEQAARFASAEAIRWLEWGTRSYQSFMFGLALVLFALVIVLTARVKRPIGYLMAVSGLASFVLGWLDGTSGFTSTAVPGLAGEGFLFAWMIWLLIVAWRGKESVQAAHA